MGKQFFVKKETIVTNKEFCKNCGATIERKTRESGFCCVQCARNYALMHNPIKPERKTFNTKELPYNSYK